LTWVASTDRFKALQVQARAWRDTNVTLTKELADLTKEHTELKEKVATTIAVPETTAPDVSRLSFSHAGQPD
jgi:predicted  nucleic acid-binding Zn-ribbon protein